jgi:predicted GNAT superfamily acetyltransferase
MFEFTEIEGKPDANELREIEVFYASIFEHVDLEKFEKRIGESENLLTIIVRQKNQIVGFKIGYQIAPEKFYSWVGGVDENFRENGIAAEMMRRQHEWCVRSGFEIVRTKTKNSFKPMLILNLKSGFDVIEVYRDAQNELKIILEKKLVQ